MTNQLQEGLLPETLDRIFSFCSADALARLLQAADSDLFSIVHHALHLQLETRLTVFSGEETELRAFVHQLLLQRKDKAGYEYEQQRFRLLRHSLQCCVILAYLDEMIRYNQQNETGSEDQLLLSSHFSWIIGADTLKADFYQPSQDSLVDDDETMAVVISCPFPWKASTLTKLDAWMERGIHTNMYITPPFSEDSIQNRIGVVTEVETKRRAIESYSFLHGNMGHDELRRWSHALVLGDEGSPFYVWVDTHLRMDGHLQIKFARLSWMLDRIQSNPRQFLCTWKESGHGTESSFDMNHVMQTMRSILCFLKRHSHWSECTRADAQVSSEV